MSDDGRFADSVVRAHWDLHTDCTLIRPTCPGLLQSRGSHLRWTDRTRQYFEEFFPRRQSPITAEHHSLLANPTLCQRLRACDNGHSREQCLSL